MEEERTGDLPDEQAFNPENISEALIEEDWNSDSADMTGKEEAGTQEFDDDEEEPENPDKLEANQSFKLKYLGQEIEVTKDEMIVLAQKGKDYDRIRTRADELSSALRQNSAYMSFLDALARKSGMDVDAFVEKTRSAILSDNDSLLQSPHINMTMSAEHEKRVYQERRNHEISEFLAEYKDIDPAMIPEDVWENVREGRPLLSAYQSHENKLLKAQIEAEKKNLENRSRSAGSRQSGGNARPHGEIEDDWYKED